MRGQLLVDMQGAKKANVVSVAEYTQFVQSVAGEFGLSNLQVRIIAGMMHEERLPLFKWAVNSIVNPVVMVSKHLREIN